VTFVQPFDGAGDDRGTEAKEKNEALSHYGKYSRYNWRFNGNRWLYDDKEHRGIQGFLRCVNLRNSKVSKSLHCCLLRLRNWG
jgi:hypothetical protein